MDSLTVGLIGAGGITHAHVPSWRALGADIVVFSDQGADALAELYGVRRVHTLAELLDSCDVVDVCTPTPTHVELVRAAMDAGRPVFCEKPLARTAADAADIARESRRRGVPVFPGHVVRYFPEYIALRDAITSGRLGQPAVLRFSRVSQAPQSAWFFDEELSGGIVLDFMLHDIDQARLLAGPVISVSAAQNPPTVAGTVPRSVVTHVTLSHRSGAISHLQAAWGPVGLTFATTFDIAGSRGRLRYDSRARSEVVADVVGVAAGAGYLPPVGPANPYAEEMKEFLALVKDGTPARVGLDDAVVAVGIADAALLALRTSDTVPFDETSTLELIGDPR
jgi:predicted dehydrogenase